jgi:mannose-6-phosphate isomerase-like protein (cupin superfamily)
MSTVLTGGCTVIAKSDFPESEGPRRFRVPISREIGAREVAQTISAYSPGTAPARRNPVGEEVLYVVRGSGVCNIEGHRYAVETGTAVYIPPGKTYQITNASVGSPGEGDLVIVSVCCPEDDDAGPVDPPESLDQLDTKPFLTIREADQHPISTGDRTFRLLANQELGCKRVTQFVGVIPPGRAPMHHHTYEEAIYIIEGQGQIWTEEGSAPFGPGTSIYLPRGVAHSLENTGANDIRLLGVFHPSGSPATRYDD